MKYNNTYIFYIDGVKTQFDSGNKKFHCVKKEEKKKTVYCDKKK